MKKENLITLQVITEKCIGCGLCEIVCPHRVLRMKERKITIQKKAECIECGACMSNCPVGAIQVKAGVGCAQAILNKGECCK